MKTNHFDLVEILLMRRHEDMVVGRFHNQVVHAPVDLQGGIEQTRIECLCRRHAAQHGCRRLFQLIERRVGCDLYELADRGEFKYRSELERLVDQGDTDVGDLDAALGYEPDKTFGLEPLECLARGAKRDIEQRAQLTLRHELPWLQVALEQLDLESLVGELTHEQFWVGLFHGSGGSGGLRL